MTLHAHKPNTYYADFTSSDIQHCTRPLFKLIDHIHSRLANIAKQSWYSPPAEGCRQHVHHSHEEHNKAEQNKPRQVVNVLHFRFSQPCDFMKGALTLPARLWSRSVITAKCRDRHLPMGVLMQNIRVKWFCGVIKNAGTWFQSVILKSWHNSSYLQLKCISL